MKYFIGLARDFDQDKSQYIRQGLREIFQTKKTLQKRKKNMEGHKEMDMNVV